MRYAVVAVAQQGLRLYPDLDTYRRDLERFFRLAELKHARLIVFPERSGLMVIPPLIEDFRSGLLKKADVNRGRQQSWWDRTRASVMRGTARLLRADISRELRRALQETPGFIWQTYVDIFASLAYEYKITVVAGSGFFPDVNDGTLYHMATVFGPEGDILGQQAKVILSEDEQDWVQAGKGWQVVSTPLGRLGIVFGEEVVYPEVGRVLAYQGAESLIVLAATRDEQVVRQLHDGLRARVAENQIFGAMAFTVGDDPFAAEERPPFRGRSVVMAPHGLTPRGNGVLVEAGSTAAEVLVTARWDFDALHAYWESAPIPVRRRLPVEPTAAILGTVYGQGMTLEDAARALPPSRPRPLPAETAEREEAQEAAEGVSPVEAPSPQEPSEAEEAPAPAPEPVAVESGTAEAEEVAPAQADTGTAEKEAAEAAVVAPRPEPEEPAAAEVAPSIPEVETQVEEARPVPESEGEPTRPEEAAAVGEPEATAGEPAAVEGEEGPTARAEGEAVTAEGGEARISPRAAEEPSAVESPETGEEPVAAAPSEAEPATTVIEAPPPTAVEMPAPPAEEDMTIPEELWAQIKQELARAAETLRSLRGEEEAPARAEPSGPARPSPARGWFHRLLSQRRAGHPDDWEEF